MNESQQDYSFRSSPSDANIAEDLPRMSLPNQSPETKAKAQLEIGPENEVNENILDDKDFIHSPFPNISKNQNNLARFNIAINIKVDEPAQNGIQFAYIESKHCATEASQGSSEHSTINENDHENIQTRIENYNLSPRIRLGNELFAQNHNQPLQLRPVRVDQADNRAPNSNNAGVNIPNRPAANIANLNRRLNREEFLIYQNFIEFYIFMILAYVILYLIMKDVTTSFAEVILVWIYGIIQIIGVIRYTYHVDGFPAANKRKFFVLFDWASIMIYCVGFALKVGVNSHTKVSSVILTPFCSFGCLNIILYIFTKTHQPQEAKNKRYALGKRIFFWAQFVLISLKLDGYVDINWSLIFLVAFVAFGFMIVYTIFPLFILVGTIRMVYRGTMAPGPVSNRVKIIGLSWCVIVTLSSTFWTVIVVGLAGYLEGHVSSVVVLHGIHAGFAHGLFIGLFTIFVRASLKTFLRSFILADFNRDRQQGSAEHRIEEIIKFEMIEPRIPYLLTISPTFHQMWKEEIKNYDKTQTKEWRKLINKVKIGKYLPMIRNLLRKESQDEEKKELKATNNKMNSSIEIVIPEKERMIGLDEMYRPKVNYTHDDLDIYEEVKRPTKHGERKEGDNICYICVQRPPDAVLMKCGHSGICYECALESWKKSEKCGMCRQRVENIIKVKYYDKLKLSKSIHGTRKIRSFNISSNV